jgi:hypothetical protein
MMMHDRAGQDMTSTSEFLEFKRCIVGAISKASATDIGRHVGTCSVLHISIIWSGVGYHTLHAIRCTDLWSVRKQFVKSNLVHVIQPKMTWTRLLITPSSPAGPKEVGVHPPLQTDSVCTRVNNEGVGSYIWDETAYTIHHLWLQRYPKRIVILNQHPRAECGERSIDRSIEAKS